MEQAGGIAALGINLKMLIAQVINFLILFLLLKYLLFGPISKMLQERSAKIKAGLEAAEKSQKEKEEIDILKEKVLAEATSRAQAIVAEAEKQSSEIRQKQVAETKDQTKQIINDAKAEIVAEKEKMVLQAKNEIADLTILVSEKVMGQKMDETIDRELVKKSIADLEKK